MRSGTTIRCRHTMCDGHSMFLASTAGLQERICTCHGRLNLAPPGGSVPRPRNSKMDSATTSGSDAEVPTSEKGTAPAVPKFSPPSGEPPAGAGTMEAAARTATPAYTTTPWLHGSWIQNFMGQGSTHFQMGRQSDGAVFQGYASYPHSGAINFAGIEEQTGPPFV